MIRAAVLGKPITHSLSPLVHTLIYRELGLESDYQRFEMDESAAKEFLLREIGGSWNGFSLTMPLKEVGFELDLEFEHDAIRSHAINTVTSQGAYNTDIPGLVRVLRREKMEFDEVIILGSGATARSCLLALEGFGYRDQITIVRRSSNRDALLPKIEASDVRLIDLDSWRPHGSSKNGLIISTLPASAQSIVSTGIAGHEGVLIDFSYSPWPSVLAGVVAGKVVSGLKVLVSQAVDQAAIFSNLDFERDEMYEKVISSTVKSLAHH